MEPLSKSLLVGDAALTEGVAELVEVDEVLARHRLDHALAPEAEAPQALEEGVVSRVALLAADKSDGRPLCRYRPRSCVTSGYDTAGR